MAENTATTQPRKLVLESKAANFREFCDLMTTFAENQLDFHR